MNYFSYYLIEAQYIGYLIELYLFGSGNVREKGDEM